MARNFLREIDDKLDALRIHGYRVLEQFIEHEGDLPDPRPVMEVPDNLKCQGPGASRR